MALPANLSLGAGYVATWLGLVPLAWLAVRRSRNVAFWWLGAAFAVSWLADMAARYLASWAFMNPLYPVSQAALIGAVLLSRRQAEWFTLALMAVGLLGVLFPSRPDVLVHTVAWGGICGLVWDRYGMDVLRTSLLVTFGLGLFAYYGFVMYPMWVTWLLYQGCRVLGTALFCYAVTLPSPRLRLT